MCGARPVRDLGRAHSLLTKPSQRVKPSTAAFADAMIAWLVKPLCAATVENKTIEPLFFFKLS